MTTLGSMMPAQRCTMRIIGSLGGHMESQPRLLDQMREVLRLKHLSFRTEAAYIGWVKRFILFHEKRHPKDMGAAEIRAFLSYLATHEHVAASTQNGAQIGRASCRERR